MRDSASRSILAVSVACLCMCGCRIDVGAHGGNGDGGSGVRDLRGWQLGPDDVGLVGAGVDKNSLPEVADLAIPSGSTVSLKKLVNPDASAGGIALERCWIVETGYGGLSGSDHGTLTVLDCDIEATQYQSQPLRTEPTNGETTVTRCDLSGGAIGFWADGPTTLRQCYVHGLISQGDNHCDGMTRRRGTGQLNVQDCRIDSYTEPNHTSATVFLQTTFGDIDNVLFRGNLFSNGSNGGGSAALEAKDGNDYGDNMVMEDNRFAGSANRYAYVWDYNLGVRGKGWGRWMDNYVDDPGKQENRGAIIEAP